MKILFVADVSIERVSSGAERVLYEHSTRLAKRGHDVHIITRKLPEHRTELEVVKGVKEWRYTFPSKEFVDLCRSTFVECRRLVSCVATKYSFDIINTYQPLSGLGAFISPATSCIPQLYTCFSFSFEEYVSRNSPPQNAKDWLLFQMQLLGRKLVEKSLLKRSNRILVLSDYTRKKLNDVYELRGSKITLIPGAVDINRFKPTDDRVAIRHNLDLPANSFILLTVRNLEPRMGIENLLLAFKTVLGEKPDSHLVIAGAGPIEQELQALVRDSGLNDLVRFTGYIPENKLPAYYQMADLFILPTLDLEGFGLVTVEALSSGLPVLGTPVGGTKEILAHMGTEFLFADTTSESMASLILEAVQTWAGDPSAYNRISQKCRKVAERHYSWESHIAKLENLCLRMIHQSSSPHAFKSRASSIQRW